MGKIDTIRSMDILMFNWSALYLVPKAMNSCRLVLVRNSQKRHCPLRLKRISSSVPESAGRREGALQVFAGAATILPVLI
jgi:hypothetical protein